MWNQVRWPRIALVFSVCFVVLAAVFVFAMIRNLREIDYPYLWYALARIAAISTLTGALALVVNKQHIVINVLFAILVGFGLAAAYVSISS